MTVLDGCNEDFSKDFRLSFRLPPNGSAFGDLVTSGNTFTKLALFANLLLPFPLLNEIFTCIKVSDVEIVGW